MATDGKQTTEFQVTQSSGFWAKVLIVLGGITMLGDPLVDALSKGDENSAIGIVGGGIVIIAGALLKMFTNLGYVKSRTDVKVSENVK